MNPSLAEVKKFKTSLKKIETRTNRKSQYAPLVRALLQLAESQNFADQGAVKQIITALNELRVTIVDAINEETAAENEA
jgi:hypothetical protein